MSNVEGGRIPPPAPLALVLCDAVWTDPSTGKEFLLGCFSDIGFPKFPIVQPRLCAYILLSNGRGKVPLRVVVVDVDEERELIREVRSEIEFPDVRSVVSVIVEFVDLEIPVPGDYRVQSSAACQCRR
jgi:hypothetical protein